MHDANSLKQLMCNEFGVLPGHLDLVIRTAPLRYKAFKIPKRSGDFREVAQPAREVKALQYLVINNLRGILPIHQAAMAYMNGVSIRNNAEVHVASNYFLKLDFKDFFPSITYDDIVRHLKKYASASFTSDAMGIIAQICTWAPDRKLPLRLCIGAPSSPIISNSILYDFDSILHRRAVAMGVNYTRYADDITLSCMEPNILEGFVAVVEDILRGLEYPRININTRKTVFGSRKSRRVVTGLVLTPDHRVSIGRERKREIRGLYYKKKMGLLTEAEIESLNGLLAFADSIEDGFSVRLASKYKAK